MVWTLEVDQECYSKYAGELKDSGTFKMVRVYGTRVKVYR